MRVRSHKIVFMINSSQKKTYKDLQYKFASYELVLRVTKRKINVEVKNQNQTKRKVELLFSLRVIIYVFFPGTSKFDEAFRRS